MKQLSTLASGEWIVWWWGTWKANSATGEPWLPLRLINAGDGMPGRGRRSYSIGWNGIRFARCTDSELVEERYPDALASIADDLRQRLPAPQVEEFDAAHFDRLAETKVGHGHAKEICRRLMGNGPDWMEGWIQDFGALFASRAEAEAAFKHWCRRLPSEVVQLAKRGSAS